MIYLYDFFYQIIVPFCSFVLFYFFVRNHILFVFFYDRNTSFRTGIRPIGVWDVIKPLPKCKLSAILFQKRLLIFFDFFLSIFSEIAAEVLNVKPIRWVKTAKDCEARVFDAILIDGKDKAQLSAWNILADFLFALLDGKEVFK